MSLALLLFYEAISISPKENKCFISTCDLKNSERALRHSHVTDNSRAAQYFGSVASQKLKSIQEVRHAHLGENRNSSNSN